MEKKPLNIVVKDADQAAKELNEIVEKGGAIFDFGINKEYAITVTKNSDGTTSEQKERRYRLVGFVEMRVGEELDSFNAVKDEMKAVQKERQEMNRTLNILNKSAFAPISILLLGIAVVTLVLGVLTLAKVLPLPAGQTPIAIVLTVIGVLSLGGAIALFILRKNKKAKLLERKDEILQEDEALKAKEKDIEARVPAWYKKALWSADGNIIRNASQEFVFEK